MEVLRKSHRAPTWLDFDNVIQPALIDVGNRKLYFRVTAAKWFVLLLFFASLCEKKVLWRIDVFILYKEAVVA